MLKWSRDTVESLARPHEMWVHLEFPNSPDMTKKGPWVSGIPKDLIEERLCIPGCLIRSNSEYFVRALKSSLEYRITVTVKSRYLHQFEKSNIQVFIWETFFWKKFIFPHLCTDLREMSNMRYSRRLDGMCYTEQLPQRERNVFCINKINCGKLPKFYHILLQDYSFFC